MQTGNLDRYHQEMWSILNSTKRPTFDKNKSIESHLSSSYLDLLKSFKNTENIKIICLKKCTEEDIKYLASLKFSLEFLLKNFRQRVGLVTHDTREFQNRAIATGYVYALCPITGQILKSNQSIPVSLSVVFHRFVGVKVFYLMTGNIGAGCPKDALYFPEDELIVRYEGHRYGFTKSHIIILKASMVNFYQGFLDYFSQANSKKIAILIGHPNFAHHLWNELSALYRIKQKRILRKIDKVFTIRETLGTIVNIFPELVNDKIQPSNKVLSLDKETSSFIKDVQPIDPQIIAEMVKNNYCFINIADTFIPHGLTQRIYRVAKQESAPETSDIIRQAKKQCFPLLWISIRTQDRTWVQQTEGLTKIINALSQKYPKLGIIFDGFSLPADCFNLTAEQLLAIDREKAVVKEIIAKINPNIAIFDVISHSIFEANLWAHAADLYLCHFGTLQHKIAWFARKPGIVHANSRISSNNNSYFRCYGVRELGIPPKFIDPSQIKNISLTMSALDLRNTVDNYDIDWKIIYDEIVKIIADLQKSRTWPGKLNNSFNFVKQYLRIKLSKMPYIRGR
jgi:hypothetical protein